jgi:hypothetical protein
MLINDKIQRFSRSGTVIGAFYLSFADLIGSGKKLKLSQKLPEGGHISHKVQTTNQHNWLIANKMIKRSL